MPKKVVQLYAKKYILIWTNTNPIIDRCTKHYNENFFKTQHTEL